MFHYTDCCSAASSHQWVWVVPLGLGKSQEGMWPLHTDSRHQGRGRTAAIQAPSNPLGADPEAQALPLARDRGQAWVRCNKDISSKARAWQKGRGGGWGVGVEALLVQNKQLKENSQPTAWSLISEPDSKLLKFHKVQAPHDSTAWCQSPALVLWKAPRPLSGRSPVWPRAGCPSQLSGGKSPDGPGPEMQTWAAARPGLLNWYKLLMSRINTMWGHLLWNGLGWMRNRTYMGRKHTCQQKIMCWKSFKLKTCRSECAEVLMLM